VCVLRKRIMNDRLNAHTKQNISFIHADNKKGDKVFIQDVPPVCINLLAEVYSLELIEHQCIYSYT